MLPARIYTFYVHKLNPSFESNCHEYEQSIRNDNIRFLMTHILIFMTHNIPSPRSSAVVILVPKRYLRIETPGDKSVFCRVAAVYSYKSGKGEKHYYSEREKRIILDRLPGMSAHLGFVGPPALYYRRFLNGFRYRAILDLNRTLILLRIACNSINTLICNKGHLLLVSTDPLCNDLIKRMGKRTNQSHVNSKWIGGFLTNWGHIRHDKRFRFPVSSRYSNYSSRFLRVQRSYEGVKTREILDGVVTLNARIDIYAICEANRSRILIVSLVDSIIPEELYRLITHPIPVNNDSIWVTNLFSLLVTKTVIHSVRAQTLSRIK